MYSCHSWAIVLFCELPCGSVCIPVVASGVHCFNSGVLFVCYTLSWVLLDEVSHVVVLVFNFW